jgi:hypothetical protein
MANNIFAEVMENLKTAVSPGRIPAVEDATSVGVSDITARRPSEPVDLPVGDEPEDINIQETESQPEDLPEEEDTSGTAEEKDALVEVDLTQYDQFLQDQEKATPGGRLELYPGRTFPPIFPIEEEEGSVSQFEARDFLRTMANAPGSFGNNFVEFGQMLLSPLETLGGITDIGKGVASIGARVLGEQGVPPISRPYPGLEEYSDPNATPMGLGAFPEEEELARRVGSQLLREYGPEGFRKTLVEDPFRILLDIAGGKAALKRVVGSRKFAQINKSLKGAAERTLGQLEERVPNFLEVADKPVKIYNTMKDALVQFRGNIPLDELKRYWDLFTPKIETLTPAGFTRKGMQTLEPATTATRVLGSGAGTVKRVTREHILPGVAGMTTGTGHITYEVFLKYLEKGGMHAKLAIAALRNKLPILEFVTQLYKLKSHGLKNLRDTRSRKYQAEKRKLEPEAPIDLGSIKENVYDYLEREWNIIPAGLAPDGVRYRRIDIPKPPMPGKKAKGKAREYPDGVVHLNYKHNTPKAKLREEGDRRIVEEIVTQIDDWPSNPDVDLADLLDITVGEIANSSVTAKRGQRIGNEIAAFVRAEISQKAPKYQALKDNYTYGSRMVDAAEDLISDKSAAALDKFSATLTDKMSSEYNREVLAIMETAGGNYPTLGVTAGHTLKQLWPVGLHGKAIAFAPIGAVLGGFYFMGPMALLSLPSILITSPRAMGHLLRKLHVSKGQAAQAVQWLEEVKKKIPAEQIVDGMNIFQVVDKAIHSGITIPPIPLYKPSKSIQSRVMGDEPDE